MDRDIKRIHIGLPQELKNKVFWISEDYRINPLSFVEGGFDVVIEYHDGNVFGYDWIKVPHSYIYKIFLESITSEISDFEELSEVRQIEVIKIKLFRIFLRKYIDEKEFQEVPFEEIWNSNSSDNLPYIEELIVLEVNDVYVHEYGKMENGRFNKSTTHNFVDFAYEDKTYSKPCIKANCECGYFSKAKIEVARSFNVYIFNVRRVIIDISLLSENEKIIRNGKIIWDW